jgi:chemotaxis protein CheZ
VQRKVFRVERMFGDRRAAAPREQAGGERDAIDQLKALRALGERRDVTGDDVTRELAAVREAIARNSQELAALIGANKARRWARAAGELGAAVDCMEKAAHKILQAAEGIDDSAKLLSAALKTDFERDLAQDIQDQTMQIYEACNFQDLAGQRIAKVIGIMHLVEQQRAAMLARCSTLAGAAEPAAVAAPAEGDGLLNGPKLDGDAGHASQGDIDAIFN